MSEDYGADASSFAGSDNEADVRTTAAAQGRFRNQVDDTITPAVRCAAKPTHSQKAQRIAVIVEKGFNARLTLDSSDSEIEDEEKNPEGESASNGNKDETTSENGVLDCARRPQKTATTRTRGKGGKRKTYTDKEYRMILDAPNNSERRIIAKALHMPWSTARDMVRRSRKNGRVHDGRHERAGKKTVQIGNNDPYSLANRGRWGKLDRKYETYLFHLIHFNCAMFATELKELVNKEIIRDFLLKHEVMPTNAGQSATASQHTDALTNGIVLGIRPLSPAERELAGPLDTTMFDENEQFKTFCAEFLIRSPQTIRNHLTKALYTRKSILIEKATANTPAAMEKRLEFAEVLKEVIDGDAGKVFLLFQDEMPFYLNMHNKRGLSKKGERAVYRGPPTSNMSFRTQLSMVVHPTIGIFYAKQYNPHKEEYVDKKGKRRTKWKSGYSFKDFENFFHLVMNKIMNILEDEDMEGHEELRGSRIYIFYDGAPEHGKKAVRGIIDRFEMNHGTVEYRDKAAFDALLNQHGCNFEPIKLSPNSPHLNLCEYYNRMIRVHATRERNMPEVHKVLQLVQGEEGAEHGTVIQNRIDAIHGCIARAIERVRISPNAVGNFDNFSRNVQKVIERHGYLNYYEPM